MVTATTVTVTHLNEPDELFHQYPGEKRPQPCHLALDLQDGELTAGYNPEIGTGIPMSVFHRRTLWIEIPCLTAAAANRLLDEVTPIAQRILDGASIEWDGNNHVGRLDDAADAAYDELVARVAPERFDADDEVSDWDAGDWYATEGSTSDTAARLGITADTSDEDIAGMAQAEAEDAKESANSGYVILRGAEEYLLNVRDELRAVEHEELREIAEQLEKLTARRAELIRRQIAWGDSSRTVGMRAGLSHVRVQQIAAEQLA